MKEDTKVWLPGILTLPCLLSLLYITHAMQIICSLHPKHVKPTSREDLMLINSSELDASYLL